MNFDIAGLTGMYEALAAFQKAGAPLYLYGTGDGADKVLAALSMKGLCADGIFVSDDFYRGQVFQDFTCRPLSEAFRMKEEGRAPVILVAFGSHFPEMIERIRRLDEDFEVFVPDVPVTLHDGKMELFDKEYYLAHEKEITVVYDLLADDVSKKVCTDILTYKITGRCAPLFSCVTDKEEVFSSLIPLTPQEDYLDLGAYNGDTIRELLSVTGGSFSSITALEPEPHSFKKLSAYVRESLADSANIRLENAGIGETTGTVLMASGRGRGSAKGKSRQFTGKMRETMIYAGDDLACAPTYVKMDVEGMERAAICGMKHTLISCRPKLNIALYHRTEDLFDLPLLLKDLLPSYRFYLRRHNCFPCWEVNLYAHPAP